ncbi:UDP-N-acetylmuramoyl-L-alanine--D-glutamate ligase [Neoehrlichia mikurensis]|uniref:UDP-N-acetylmuramoylalanine--D-glutamate ligase n=1 Tax=Neoehrlichia mikurensis TaxID=89586 RepID=A0A9Q9BTZ3_9RICK|nr:UDP-N-acetylmuramoyl-L-alanine--D-glutamate ligase [Neoehrlichia mikurensis]QXK92177.1 UDP-N-acetylmuramoyl-L-alanine--D-glutamate ligase [Neoehrlichia mikurensis]QXK92632.1 UDP-N-acetylmuramoyl-L-alanine--D-glutamate ligase [Neoehrlichia mikurensis]QXK93871.1 UDP-N-acetylmuramoyl-L-alanine--D-glutamate ligase [Neoehrlichia mikurensis]UTO55133.1 UDP-N-acetylmuramoyl-L-alanine--D-glutamate ligase [Neoehrlichia mikurensis]UTO56053.1 UDP-N-acetylmuramoyl-L-alanine--D-glutamate ligase [Neoehrli
MILLPHYNGKKVAVFGLGITGTSAMKSLSLSGAQVFLWDDNISVLKDMEMSVNCCCINPNEYNWNEISSLILSPGISYFGDKQHWIVKLAKYHNCPIISDIELLYQAQKKSKFVCITGTNGKSTTTELIGWIFKCAKINVAVGGNIGKGALTLDPDAEIYVLELSSQQISLLNVINIDVAVLLNITADHIDIYGDMINYTSVKIKVLNYSKLSIINYDNDITNAVFRNITGNKIAFSSTVKLDEGISFIDDYLYVGDKALKVGKLCVNKKSNLENFAASYAVAKHFGVSDDVIISAMETFKGLKHRNQLVGKMHNVFFVNDSKATNASATKRALMSYQNIYWIVGGRSKDMGISELKIYFDRVKKAFLIGESIIKLENVMKDYGISYIKCYNLDIAVQTAYAFAIEDMQEAVILLSPACSSWDQWNNFEERGNKFCELVQELIAGGDIT